MNILMFIWQEFLKWLGIFIAPMQNVEMLWIIIPVYLNWIFTEIYQEKKFTSFGNAISNGTVVLWAGIDWVRFTVRQLSSGTVLWGPETLIKIIFALIVLAYGVTIIVMGVKLRKITHYIGRIREVSYVLLMFTPIMYNVIKLNFENLLLILIMFPVFYFIIEGIDLITPNPKTYEEDEKEESEAKTLGSIKKQLNEPKTSFGSSVQRIPGTQLPPKTEDIGLQNIEEELKKLKI